jgi:crotonobetainyl-CoA:carnitine CoA-transferase CaiB-like acyl-CoA transferase
MRQGLESLQVIEIGGGIASGVAGKALADLGASVVKIEHPRGDETRRRGPFRNGRADPEASGTFLFLNANKRSLAADLAKPEGRRALDDLAGRADLLIHDVDASCMPKCGLDYERLAAVNPALVMLSLTPFGLTGPYRDYAAAELTLFHASGWGWCCPGDSTPLSFPPSKPFGQHALIQAGLHGAVAALAACASAMESGIGEHIDLSAVEATTFQLGRHTARFPFSGLSDSRDSPQPYEPFSFYPCKDGWIYIVTPEQDQWNRLVELMGHPAWCDDPRFTSRKGREQHGPALKAYLREWTAQQEMEFLFHACQRVRAGAAPVLGYPQVEHQEHLKAREVFVTQRHPAAGAFRMPGAPYLLRQPWWRLDRAAPLLGEANGDQERLFDEDGRPPRKRPPSGGSPPPPLAGVRVLDLTWLWTGPHCTMALAFLGADVIKVESSKRPDLTRRSHIFPPGMEPGLNRCGYFNQIGQSKRSIGIDLQTPEGVELVLRLAERSDVMVSNFATGVMERLGLGADEALARNPHLIVATISAFGQTGPLKDYMGYGPLVHAVGGLSAQSGYADGIPRDIGMAYGDPNAGVHAAIAIAAALWARKRHGGAGQVIDVSMWDAMLVTAFEGWMNHALGNPPHPMMGNRDPVWAPHNLYRCAGDDEWIAIAVTDDEQWRGLCRAVGDPALAADARWRDAPSRKRNEDALDTRIAAWCATLDKWEATQRLQAEKVPAFPSLDNEELLDDPHLNARGLFTAWPHPEVGARKLVGAPWHFARRRNGHGFVAPCLGQHTDEILGGILGQDRAELARLREQQVIE